MEVELLQYVAMVFLNKLEQWLMHRVSDFVKKRIYQQEFLSREKYLDKVTWQCWELYKVNLSQAPCSSQIWQLPGGEQTPGPGAQHQPPGPEAFSVRADRPQIPRAGAAPPGPWVLRGPQTGLRHCEHWLTLIFNLIV